MPVAARRRQPSSRYSDRGSCWVRRDRCSQSAGHSVCLPVPRSSGGCRSAACRGGVSLLYQSRPLLSIWQYVYLQQASLKSDESTSGSLLPASPLIARFGRPDRRKQPPVRPLRVGLVSI
jgi:hypothetical protein